MIYQTEILYFAGMSSYHRLSWRVQWCRFKRGQRLHLSRGSENSGRKVSWPRSLFHGHCSRSLWRWHSSLCWRWSLSWSQKVSLYFEYSYWVTLAELLSNSISLFRYVEVAYKCKPTVFKSKVVCQDKDLKLQCGNSETENNDTRIAIYSSSFSASGGTHIYCPSEGKKDFDSAFDQQACEEQYVTEPVMKLCHGQRKFFFCFFKNIFFDLL